jgi:hypothetical protein
VGMIGWMTRLGDPTVGFLCGTLPKLSMKRYEAL